MATNYSPKTKHILKWLEKNVENYVTYDDAKIMPAMRAGFDVKRFMRDVKKEIEDEPDMVSIDKAYEWLLENTLSELCLDLGNVQLVREFTDNFKDAMKV